MIALSMRLSKWDWENKQKINISQLETCPGYASNGKDENKNRKPSGLPRVRTGKWLNLGKNTIPLFPLFFAVHHVLLICEAYGAHVQEVTGEISQTISINVKLS